ncbi:HpcH/HpaI aldolase family protein [Oceanibaculum pacificum]|uniref:4-hydroxy-2-oxo-heptane-1,7-dioate aldolase n=1 Tax=Oceanibaculum pacificum TaxID=580166 RepID=A0A154V8H9_9PROT|nr:HpcH/HpaI aldolase/citrate lyase family protein [Oceanibaculum pacificum]KZC97683.1 4-hydroxy-2-oxo-heptane-1,7-dioate aldolase [Oceanibaculum pacificum]
MELPRNAFKKALHDGKLQIGFWSGLCSPMVADILSEAGYDWLVLDAEHSPNDPIDIMHQLMAMEHQSVTMPVIRVPWNDQVFIKRVLDVGARTILVPMVETAEQARAAVAACRYPPQGMRGVAGSMRASRYGRIKDYHKKSNAEICVLLQVETKPGLDALDEIASVEGVDGVFIGPADLSAALGYLGDNRNPAVREAILGALARLKKAGVSAGILAPVEEDAKFWIEQGFGFVALGNDAALLARQAEALCARFKG